jgi:hypothetical protein
MLWWWNSSVYADYPTLKLEWWCYGDKTLRTATDYQTRKLEREWISDDTLGTATAYPNIKMWVLPNVMLWWWNSSDCNNIWVLILVDKTLRTATRLSSTQMKVCDPSHAPISGVLWFGDYWSANSGKPLWTATDLTQHWNQILVLLKVMRVTNLFEC